MGTKVCSRCEEEKSVDEFYKKKDHPDGLRYWCIECCKQTTRNWQKANPRKKKEIDYRYNRNKRKKDLSFRIWCNVKSRIWKALNGNPRTGSNKELLGCSPEELVEHLENQLKEGMTLDNYGEFWEMDHIKPFACFDMSDPEQQREACHYSNIQPLIGTENRIKAHEILN